MREDPEGEERTTMTPGLRVRQAGTLYPAGAAPVAKSEAPQQRSAVTT